MACLHGFFGQILSPKQVWFVSLFPLKYRLKQAVSRFTFFLKFVCFTVGQDDSLNLHVLHRNINFRGPKKELQIWAHLTQLWRMLRTSRNQYLTAGYPISETSMHKQKNKGYRTTGRYLGTEWEKNQNYKQTLIKTPDSLIWYHITCSAKSVHTCNVF